MAGATASSIAIATIAANTISFLIPCHSLRPPAPVWRGLLAYYTSGPAVIASARLEDAATTGAGAAETLPFERLAQRSFRPLGADLDVLATSESPFLGRSARIPPGR